MILTFRMEKRKIGDIFKGLGNFLKVKNRLYGHSFSICAYKGVRNVSFSENFEYVLNEWHLIVLIVWLLLQNSVIYANISDGFFLCVFIVNFEFVSRLFLIFLFLTLSRQVFAGLFPTLSHTFIVEHIKPAQLTFTCSKLTVETPENMWNIFKVNSKNTRTVTPRSVVLIVSFEHISHLLLVFLLLTLSKLLFAEWPSFWKKLWNMLFLG